jgi:hypothetical protein
LCDASPLNTNVHMPTRERRGLLTAFGEWDRLSESPPQPSDVYDLLQMQLGETKRTRITYEVTLVWPLQERSLSPG